MEDRNDQELKRALVRRRTLVLTKIFD